LNEPAQLFHEALFEAFVSGEHFRLGNAVFAAQEDDDETGALPELLAMCWLFGELLCSAVNLQARWGKKTQT